MITKRYGNEKTNLRLTGKALEFYNNTDPLIILEHIDTNIEGEKIYTYTTDGAIAIYEPISEKELISFFQGCQQEIHDYEAGSDKDLSKYDID